MFARFADRRHAGRELRSLLLGYAHRVDVTVLALPRGGVPVAYEIAQSLGAPLDVIVVRKLGMPGHEEYAMGAIASGGVRVLDAEIVRSNAVTEQALASVIAREEQELERRERRIRGDRPPASVAGRTVIIVDDGLATGATMRVAVAAIRQRAAARILVAAPVSSREAYDAVRADADEVICLLIPESFLAVGAWYANFAQTTDEEVRLLLG